MRKEQSVSSRSSRSGPFRPPTLGTDVLPCVPQLLRPVAVTGAVLVLLGAMVQTGNELVLQEVAGRVAFLPERILKETPASF